MSKAVLLAVRPEWCEKILSGEKTVEARKSYPKIETPFRVLLYCTKGGRTLYRSGYDGEIRLYRRKNPLAFSHHTVMNGRVVGEFTCRKLVWVVSHPAVFGGVDLLHQRAIRDACLSEDETIRYAAGKDVYGWQIGGVRIYDEPLELRELGVDKPPQSWRYVEEKGD